MWVKGHKPLKKVALSRFKLPIGRAPAQQASGGDSCALHAIGRVAMKPRDMRFGRGWFGKAADWAKGELWESHP